MAMPPVVPVPQCWLCRHFHDGPDRPTCFPADIPLEIYLNRHDHRAPFGDDALRFEPLDEDAAAYHTLIFEHLERVPDLLIPGGRGR